LKLAVDGHKQFKIGVYSHMQQSLQAKNKISKVLATAPNTYFLGTKKHYQPMNS
jgi:hypothetical protein